MPNAYLSHRRQSPTLFSHIQAALRHLRNNPEKVGFVNLSPRPDHFVSTPGFRHVYRSNGNRQR